MWDDSQSENARLHLELNEAKSDLETARHGVESIAKQAIFSCPFDIH